jgi:uncharacterized delta-60 repeat protein
MRCSALGRRVFHGMSPGAFAALGLLVVSLHTAPGYAFPGELDPSFGTKGVVITDFAGGEDMAFALVRQSDGRLVAAGRSTTGGSADFALARYNTDGSLDPGFGTGGQALTDFGGNRCLGGPRNAQSCQAATDCPGGRCISSDDVAWALALQSDGKLVAAGERRACVGGPNDGARCQVDSDCSFPAGLCLADFALARYNTDGSIDVTFGSAGRVVTDFGGDDEAFAVAVQDDGKIVVAGVSTASGTMDFALARYTSDGELDATFGSGGKVFTDLGAQDEAFSLVVQGDGKLVAAGVSTSAGSLDFALVRYGTDGALDSSFGTGGQVVTDFGPFFVGNPANCAQTPGDFHGTDVAFTVALQSDGKLVAAGVSSGDFALARYNTDGTLDTSFGTCGQVVTDFAGDDAAASALVIQPDGKLVTAGRNKVSNQAAFALARYATDGTLDLIFGAAGRVVTPVGSDADAAALVLQPDGALVAAGGAGNDFALARYEGDFATLGITKAGSGSGRVTSTPVGIDCGPSCSALFPFNAVVSLTATADPGSVFAGWSGDPDCADGAVTMDNDKICTATFEVIVPLTVTKAGKGSGTVTSTPAGIDCGATCTSGFPMGTVVTLTATPTPGSTFVGWTGDPGCSNGSVTVDTAKTCTANFTTSLVTLNVAKFGAGSGTVTSDPPGIDCGATCAATFPRNTVVTLSAVPAPGSYFVGWNCTTNGSATVTLDSSKTCTGTFALTGTNLAGRWIALKQVCAGPGGAPPCRLKGRFAVRNIGAGRAAASVLPFYLSSDGAAPTSLLKQVKVRAMAPGDGVRIRLRAAVAGGSATGLFVLAVMPNGIVPFGPIP